MQATDKATREAQRNAAYESLHYACLQVIEILKPTIIKEKRREIVNIDVLNAETLAKYQFKETAAEISVNVDIDDTEAMLSIRGSVCIKSEIFAYTFALDNIEQLYNKLKKVLPEYRNTYEIERIETETHENWQYCATISDKKEFKAVAAYIDKKNDLHPNMQHIYISSEYGEIVASDSHILTARHIKADRSAMIPLDAQKYIAESKQESIIYVNKPGDKMRVVNLLDEKIFPIDASLEYPAYNNVIPAKTDKRVHFSDKKELLKSIKLVAKNANKASQLLKFKLEAGQCTIYAGDIDYSASGSISINCTSTISGEIGVKASNIERVLKSIDSNIINISLTDSYRAILVNRNSLIMPMICGEYDKFEYITQQAAPIAEPQAEAIEPTGRYLPVLYVAPAESVCNLPAIYTALQETAEAEPLRYLPVLYKKPKKIRKPRAKKNKEPMQQAEITTKTRENVAPSRGGARKNRLSKYLAAFAMVCIMLIINTDKVNGKNNLSKREKISNEVLQERNKAVYLYHNNSNKAVIVIQSKMAEFLNVWKSTEQKPVYYNLDQKLYCMGDWAIYKESKESHFYTYKNIAIGYTVGCSIEILNALVNNKRPTDNTCYLFDRMNEFRIRGLIYMGISEIIDIDTPLECIKPGMTVIDEGVETTVGKDYITFNDFSGWTYRGRCYPKTITRRQWTVNANNGTVLRG